MQKTVYLCDKCRQEIIKERYSISIKLEKMDPELELVFDLCPKCKSRLDEWIKTRPKKPGRPKAVDMSKVIMLWEMGWDKEKIADELGATPAQINNIIDGLPLEGLAEIGESYEKDEDYLLPEDDLTLD